MKRWQALLIMVFTLGAIGGFFCSELGIITSDLPAYNLQQEDLAKELADVPAPSRRFVTISKLVTPAVVHITSSGERAVNDPFAEFFGEFFRRRMGPSIVPTTSFGSGVIVDGEGHVLTNCHVVRNAKKVLVKLGDGREFDAGILGSDPKTDLAVLKISGDNLPKARLGDSDKIEVGEWVMAIGNPFGLEQTVTTGIVSAKGRADVGIAELEDFIQTDAAINPGNSGGPLVNMDGRVIGITSAIASNTGGYQGIGFAIPSNMAAVVMKDIIKQGKVRRGWIGAYAMDLTPRLAKELDIPYKRGVIVHRITGGSPVAKAGLKVGDVITKINKVPLTSAAQFRNTIATTEIGKEFSLTFTRDGKEIEIKVKVTEPEFGAEFKGLKTETSLGMTVTNLTDDLAACYGYENEKGVIVTGVEEGGIAEQAGIRPKDLILGISGYRSTNLEDFKELAESVRPGRRTRIHVRTGDRIRVLIIR